MSRRQLIIVAFGGSLGVVVTFASVAHFRVSRDVDRALAEAAEPPTGPRLQPIPATAFDAPSKLWTDTSSINDCAVKQGRLYAATEGGLVSLNEAGSPHSTATIRNTPGLADHALTATAARGEALVAGSRSGTISVFERGAVRSFRFDRGRFGAVTDILWRDEEIFVATTSGTVLRVDPRLEHVAALSPSINGGATALAENAERVTAAGADGSVYLVEEDELVPYAEPASGAPATRLTALAWLGDQLFVGSPTALLRVDDGALSPVREDLFVTSLVANGRDLVVGTFDDGLLLLDAAHPSATPRRHLFAGQRVDRLRLQDDRVVAAGPGLVARIDTETFEVQRFELLESIASNHITALAHDDQGRLWVGHFDAGVDVIDEVALNRSLPERTSQVLRELAEVNDFAFDPEARAMLVATSRGVLEARAESHRIIDTDDGLIGESVTAVLTHAGERVYATNRGLTIDSDGMRSIYAFHGLPSNRLYGLARREDGHLLVATLAGAARVEGLRVRDTVRATPNGLGANWCAAVVTTEEGAYVGTVGGGVNLWTRAGEVRRIALPDGGHRYTVNPGAMLTTGDRLLVGTLENGLLIFDRDRSEWVGLEQPMPGAAVTAIAIEADSRELILGTDRGLLQLSGESLGGFE